MHAATDRLEFAPPPTPGLLRALGLAVLAHFFLLAALTLGVHWKREAVTVTAEAELWSAVPQLAAPKLVEVPPEPPETPKPPVAKPIPKPPTPAAPPQVQPKLPDADIALEREKLRLKKEKQQELQKQQELEKQRLETLRLEKLKQEKLEKLKLEKLKLEKLNQEKLLLEKKRLQEKRDQDRKVAEDKKKPDQDTKRKEALQAQQDAQKMEAQRQKNIADMIKNAGGTGASNSKGTGKQSSGPSTSYAGRIVERIKSNTTFTDASAGKPTVIVLVRAASSGTILSRRVVTPSGNKAWDDAVLRAIDKMETLPRDLDGRIPEIIQRDGLELTVSL